MLVCLILSIGGYAFYGSEIRMVEFAPNSQITEIGDNAFGFSSGGKISTVIFPSTIKVIGEQAFLGQSRLTDIIIPEGLVSIKMMAFGGCSNLKGIVFPSTLQTIQSKAFSGCSGITSIICLSKEPPTVQDGAFNGVPKDNFTVEVPANAVTRYATDPVWG